ncbi:M20 family metallopeptidase [Ulvibacterium sp.]|uniref:M20 metallopeptidase family protein n=1 Tax=Ulvibacterium sp. TaxID=2665914 RepID=UPI00262A5634|nr:M20 family metallopeptidase [Ulvibacterium sp.]
MDIRENIKSLAQKFAPEFVAVRRHLHQNPELSFQEHNTSRYIKERLQAIGIKDIVVVAETGLLATIQGERKGEAVLLRADMDALPILEKNKVPYASKNDGIMHACGHDAHSASLLLCAKILWELKKEIKGSIKLLFQPGEEVVPGGASLVMKEKAYLDLGCLPHLGQHVQPNLPVGVVGFRSGKFMASMDELFLTVKGKGGHGAMPERLVDPVLIASHIIVAAQQLVSRMASPQTPSVLSFGKVIADGAINVVPFEVHIEGTFRTFDTLWRKEALQRLEKLVTSIAEGMGGSCELKINHGYPYLDNDTDLTRDMKSAANEYLGSKNVVDLEPWMAAEDFAYYSQKNPSCFYLIGVGNEQKGIRSGLHTPTFDIDEDALGIGGGLMAWLAVKNLGHG